MWKSLQTRYDWMAGKLAALDVFDLVAGFTAIVMLRNSHTTLYTLLSLVAILAMTVSRRVRHSPWFWFGVTAIWVPRLVLDWYGNEDHIFFGVYWFAAIGLALLGKQQRFVLTQSARLLIGLCFGIALFWKLVVPEFHDASLFHYKLLYDYRFREMVTRPLAGLSTADEVANVEAIRQLRRSPQQPLARRISIPDSVTNIAILMTGCTIVMEGLLAALFLLPTTDLTNRWRDPTLLLFMVTIYPIVPVLGFASIFTAMGIAQDESRHGRWRLAYALTLGLLTVWFHARGLVFPGVA